MEDLNFYLVFEQRFETETQAGRIMPTTAQRRKIFGSEEKATLTKRRLEKL
jgi:hypothetical protein